MLKNIELFTQYKIGISEFIDAARITEDIKNKLQKIYDRVGFYPYGIKMTLEKFKTISKGFKSLQTIGVCHQEYHSQAQTVLAVMFSNY